MDWFKRKDKKIKQKKKNLYQMAYGKSVHRVVKSYLSLNSIKVYRFVVIATTIFV